MYMYTYILAHLCIGAAWRPVVEVPATMPRLDQTTVTNQPISPSMVGELTWVGLFLLQEANPRTARSKPTNCRKQTHEA